jgi:hypothetical protein
LLGSDDEEGKSKKSEQRTRKRRKGKKGKRSSDMSEEDYDSFDEYSEDEEVYSNDRPKKETPSERRSRRKAKREQKKKRREKIERTRESSKDHNEEDSLDTPQRLAEGKNSTTPPRSESKKPTAGQVTFEVPTTDDDSTISPSKSMARDQHGMLKPILSNEEKKDYEVRLLESERVFLKEFKLMMVDGFRVQKHGRRGKPHFRTIRLSPDTGCLYWGSQKANSKSEFILIEDIREVRRGAFDGVLMTKERSDRCFSLITDKRRLDFETADPDTRSLISDGFMLLLKEKRCR